MNYHMYQNRTCFMKFFSFIAIGSLMYYFFGPKGDKNRARWMNKINYWKNKLMDKYYEFRENVNPIYEEIVEEMQSKYDDLKDIDKEELGYIISDISDHIRSIKEDIGKAANEVRKPKRKNNGQ